MPDILVPAGWLTHESGEKWYWDGHGIRGNLTDYRAALLGTDTPAGAAALRPGPEIPGGPDVNLIEIVGEERHLPAIERLFDGGDPAGEMTVYATLNAVPGHRDDPYAVEVLIDGHTVGHIPSDVTPGLQPTVVASGPVEDVVARVLLGKRAGAPWARITLFYVPN